MKKHIIKALSIGLVSAVTFTSCSDGFLEDKRNFDNVSVDIYNNYDGANTRLNDLYAWSLPNVNAAAAWNNNTTGNDDGQGKCTEEYSGFGDFVNPENKLSSMNDPKVADFFHNQGNNIQASVWGRIRNINDFIEGVENGELPQADKDKLSGQALFLRAWCYYQMAKWYGGLPLISGVLEPEPGNSTERSSAKATFEFIIKDLDESAKRLGTTAWGDADWGHVDAATALALKGRILNLWASPMFNRKNDKTRWKTAYDEQLKDLETINALGYGLYTSSGNVNASDFAALFAKIRSKEALFVTLYNTSTLDDGAKNNGWENSIRPRNIGGAGGKEASAMLVDMFPMADGKVPATAGTYTKLETAEYNDSFPFMNRDPRFYRTFAFPGVRWASSGSTADVGKTGSFLPVYNGGYELWNYVWYVEQNDQGNVESGNSYGADSLLTHKRGVYVRKRSIDADVAGAEALYSWSAANAVYGTGKGYALSAAPYIEIRYAEVLLNLAEAAAGSGNLAKAVECLQLIRARAGYTAENNYGLQANLIADEQACMSAVLYERQIELAYEGKRFDDCRRWMLYDGGAVKVAGAPDTWTLTGWGGNTCTWLGFRALNGQRRENMQFRVADKFGVGTDKAESDPIMSRYASAAGKKEAAEAALSKAKEDLQKAESDLQSANAELAAAESAIQEADRQLQELERQMEEGEIIPPVYVEESAKWEAKKNEAIAKKNAANASIAAATAAKAAAEQTIAAETLVLKQAEMDLANCKRCAALDYRKPLAPQTDELRNWYRYNLVRKLIKGDGRDSQHNDLYITFQPYYYFLGLSSGAQASNKALPQTIGWEDYNNGGAPGTFDPLAE